MFDTEFDAADMQDASDIESDVEFLDTSDVDVDFTDSSEEADDGFYHATRMSEDEVSRIEDMWSEDDKALGDIEPYRATRHSEMQEMSDDMLAGNDIPEMDSYASLEEQFVSDIENMSMEELGYDVAGKEKYDSELFDSLTDGMSRETLEHLKDGLETGNPDVYDYFGLNGDVEEDVEGEMTLSRKR